MADEPIADVVARVLAADEQATPGPWEAQYSNVVVSHPKSRLLCSTDITDPWRGTAEADAEWIASTRADAVTLAREVERLQKGIDGARTLLENCRTTIHSYATDLSKERREVERLRAVLAEASGEVTGASRAKDFHRIGRAVRVMQRALLAPTTEPTSTETTDG